jgi:hypothetical protein
MKVFNRKEHCIKCGVYFGEMSDRDIPITEDYCPSCRWSLKI